jgi:hypothetical protein
MNLYYQKNESDLSKVSWPLQKRRPMPLVEC